MNSTWSKGNKAVRLIAGGALVLAALQAGGATTALTGEASPVAAAPLTVGPGNEDWGTAPATTAGNEDWGLPPATFANEDWGIPPATAGNEDWGTAPAGADNEDWG